MSLLQEEGPPVDGIYFIPEYLNLFDHVRGVDVTKGHLVIYGTRAGESWTKPSASEFKTVRLFYPIRFKWLSFLCDSGLCL